MKNKLYLFIVLSLGLAFISGCNEDELLTKYPKDAPNADNFFVNETSARQAAQSPFAIMTQIPHDFKRYWVTYLDIFSDDSYTRNVGDRLPALNWSADPTWYHWYSWYFCFFKGINNANFAIDGIPTSSDPAFTAEDQAKYIAVAKLAKGFCYLELATLWGDVTYFPHFLKNPDSAFVARTPKSEVMVRLIEDLTYAAENLPDTWTGSDEGFPTKAAGAAMLAKAYLYNRDWPNAVTAAANALTIADAEGYGLMDDYVYMMSYESQVNGDNTEFIYSFPFILDGATTGNHNEMQVERLCRDAPNEVKSIYGAGWGYALPSRDLVEAFEPGDPRREYSIWLPGDFYGVYNQNDDFTIPGDALHGSVDTVIHKGDNIYYKYGWSYANTNTRKIWQPIMKDGTPLQISDDQAGYDIPLLRYADLVLFYAEALIENNQVPEGMAQLNRVRARPSVNMPPLTATDQMDARKKLRHERRIEFNMEGLRLHDLMRWTADDGVSGSYLEQIFGSGLNGKPVLMRYGDDVTLKDQSLEYPKNLLFAIPQDELDRNKFCTPNPGW
ncbi:MAG: RagB/SusD family nutrient uptake outer membrane protein [Bacteroidales bacterium]|nr:RagB/SusD family nutrient uptake outer membrane protein [Bacteroidales bacterium]